MWLKNTKTDKFRLCKCSEIFRPFNRLPCTCKNAFLQNRMLLNIAVWAPMMDVIHCCPGQRSNQEENPQRSRFPQGQPASMPAVIRGCSRVEHKIEQANIEIADCSADAKIYAPPDIYISGPFIVYMSHVAPTSARRCA